MNSQIFAICLVIVGTVFGSFGAVYLKRGSAAFNINPFAQLKNRSLILGILLYVMATAVSLPAYRYAEISLLYPFVSLSYVFVSLLSVKMLSEHMNSMKWLGIFLIMAGVTLVGIGGV